MPGSIAAQLAAGEDLSEGLRPGNLRYQKIAGRCRENLLFLIDTSGSVLADHRFANIKGFMLSHLKNTYSKRTRIAMIRYGAGKAVLELPFTSSAELAAQKIEALKGGGSTPLVPALGIAGRLVERMKDENLKIYLLSDGRYDRGRTGHENQQIREFGALCHRRSVPITLINAGADTKTSKARAASLAAMLQSQSIRLEDLRDE